MIWTADDAKVLDPDLEETRRFLLNPYHSYIQAHAGYSARETNDLAKGLNLLFDRVVEVPRLGHGSRQTLGILVNEEAYLAKSMKNEKQTWIPGILTLCYDAAFKAIFAVSVFNCESARNRKGFLGTFMSEKGKWDC